MHKYAYDRIQERLEEFFAHVEKNALYYTAHPYIFTQEFFARNLMFERQNRVEVPKDLFTDDVDMMNWYTVFHIYLI